jgi:hypothetical protein
LRHLRVERRDLFVLLVGVGVITVDRSHGFELDDA